MGVSAILSPGEYQSTMVRSGVTLLLAISFITITQVWGGCMDFICYHDDKTTMYVDQRDICFFFTQPDSRYPPPRGASCVVKYKMGDCKRVQFGCDSLHLWNRDRVPGRCNKGDKMILYRHEDEGMIYPTRKFCRNFAPKNFRSTNGLNVRLVIDK